MKILITDKVDSLFIELLKKHNIRYQLSTSTDKKTILKTINEFEGLIVRNRLEIDEAFLNNAQHLKFIGRYGSGMEMIDLEKAQELNILCFNSGEGNSNAVAEHTLGMLLCLFHKITSSMNQLKNSVWERESNRGFELDRKTVGIIGYGNTGTAFSEKLKSFNCKIIAYDKYKSGFTNKVVTEVDMKTIYRNSDVISLHIPLNKKTMHLFDSSFINKMKNPFYIINTSRGKIVCTKDLIIGLKENKILGAGLDVHENENKTFNGINTNNDFNYLLNCNNVILTPHIAGLTKESNQKLSKVLIEKILKIK